VEDDVAGIVSRLPGLTRVLPSPTPISDSIVSGGSPRVAASMNDVANGLRPQSPLEAPQGPGQGHARAPTRDVQRLGDDVHATRRGPWRSVRTDCDLRRDIGGLSRSRSHFAHVRIVAFEKTSVKHNTSCLLSFVDRVLVTR